MTKHRKGGALKAQVRRAIKYIPVYETYWEQTCEVCGKRFISSRSDALYDTPACRAKAYRQRKQDRRAMIEMQQSERLFDSPLHPDGNSSLNMKEAFPWSRSRPQS